MEHSDRWGDPISAERAAELELRMQAWETETDHHNCRSPYAQMSLTGADVLWITARVNSGYWHARSNEGPLPAEKISREAELLHRIAKKGPLDIKQDLYETDFQRQEVADDLRWHNMRRTLAMVHLEEANLSGAHLEQAILGEVHLEGAILVNAHLEGAFLQNTHLEGADLRSAHLEQANLRWAHLQRANLLGAHLEQADLREANLEQADLRGVQLDRTDLREARLEETDLHATQLDQAYFSIKQLTGPLPKKMHLPARSRDAMLRAAIRFEQELETLRREKGAAEAEGFRFFWQFPERSNETAEFVDEGVVCTTYYPKEMALAIWETLLIYLSIDHIKAFEAIAAHAAARLDGKKEQFRSSAGAGPSPLRKGTSLSIVPVLQGFRCNPPSLTVTWEEDAQCHEFRLYAESVLPDQAVNGSIQVFVGPLLFIEAPLSIFVTQKNEREAHAAGFMRMMARAYRWIFPAYAHQDAKIVDLCEMAIQQLGDQYLRDIRVLRSGETWNKRLMQAIDEADIFQLFWSEAAAKSHYVEQEWHYALSLETARQHFIRPLYWSSLPYPIPPELNHVHFEYLDLSRLPERDSTMSEQEAPPLKIFYCYAHEDKDLRDQIDKHLGILRRCGQVIGWHDREIQPGVDWSREIEEKLLSANIILLLVSADFIASDYCYGVEMKKALVLHQTSQAYVIPIVLRSVDWKGAPFAKLQMLPTGAKPISEWKDQDEALKDVAEGIRSVVDSLWSQKR